MMNDKQKEYLISVGIDLDNVVNYTGDLEMYHEILLEFYDGLDSQFASIKNTINDLPNYAILVHALKSNARTLGLSNLADVSYKHEISSKEGNSAFVVNDISSIENEVNNVKLLIETYKNM